MVAILPVTAALIGVIVLGQTPTVVEALGIALVALAIATRDRSEERAVASA